MNNIAIITARGGSKRIPKKNIKNFCGKPIIAYSIEAALNSGLFDEVMVSTDDEEIATIAKAYGAKVPFLRSGKNSDDYVGTDEVVKEVLVNYQKQDICFDYVCCIYPTAPFITGETLVNAYNSLIKSSAEALVPVVRFSYPPQRAFLIKNDKLEYQNNENISKRSQDLEELFHDVGQFYFWQEKYFWDNINQLPLNTIPYLLTELGIQDIDTTDDWKMAELKYRLLKGEGGL
ncbi:MAG: pseudaminic acid cytidylyltransferase [Acidaminococcaceae bacterium]